MIEDNKYYDNYDYSYIYALEQQPLFGTGTNALEQRPLTKWIINLYNKHFKPLNYTTEC